MMKRYTLLIKKSDNSNRLLKSLKLAAVALQSQVWSCRIRSEVLHQLLPCQVELLVSPPHVLLLIVTCLPAATTLHYLRPQLLT